MKKPIILLVTGLLMAQPASAKSERKYDLLSKGYPLEKVEQLVEKYPSFNLFPSCENRERWQSLPGYMKNALVQRGEKGLDYQYHGVPASKYFDGVKTGNYNISRGLQTEARRHLANMVFAECVEYKGRFISNIVDVLWAIAEESSWPSLSHFYLHKEGDHAKLVLALPDVTDPVVDLWGATTAKNFAWIYHLLGNKFDELTPRINNRIKYEVNKRVLDPAIERDDFWWMGFSAGNGGIINNWNPWISSNWLPAILLIEDPKERAKALHKLLRVVDQFINSYTDDGGIDEGPAYWNRAAGSLFDTLSILYNWSNGEINIFDNPKIRNMLQYIYNAHIHGRYVVNFTDAPPRLKPNSDLLFRIGQVLGDPKMSDFAALWVVDEKALIESGHFVESKGGMPDLDREMYPLFNPNKGNKETAVAPYVQDVWYPGVQHMMARSYDGKKDGFFVAAKGGHNNESHNHNDVGSFMLYFDGNPLLIDVGAGTYTLKTFGKDRYKLWNMQSAYHNLPTVNGTMQRHGAQYKATDVQYQSTPEQAQLKLDIAKSYPEEAGINSWVRTIDLNRIEGSHNVVISEDFSLNKVSGKTVMNFISPAKVKLSKGKLTFNAGSKKVVMEFNPALFDARVEKFELEDKRIARGWNVDYLSLIKLTAKKMPKKGQWQVKLYER